MRKLIRLPLKVLGGTMQGIQRARATTAAASLAYYAFFSLFPLLLFLVGAGGFILRSTSAYDHVVELVGTVFPASLDLIAGSLRQVVLRRGSIGLIGLVALLWSASSFFGVLAENLCAAWPDARLRSFLRGRLVAIEMIAVLAVLLILAVASSALIRILPHVQLPVIGDVNLGDGGFWERVTAIAPWVLSWALFLSLYRWVPNTPVRWAPALIGSALATIAWQGAASAFAWYLRSGLGRYELVYGSLGAVVALLVWIYLSALITLVGAHFTAALDAQWPESTPQSSP